MWLSYIFLVCSYYSSVVLSGDSVTQLDDIFDWQLIEFGFSSIKDRNHAISNNYWTVGQGYLIDVDVDYRDHEPTRIFTTIGRNNTEVPYTLAVISDKQELYGPALKPYPNYAWHSSQGYDCDRITSVNNIFIDKCKRLWILDTGKIGDIQYCAPQLLVFHLKTDNLIHRYRFPTNQYVWNTSLLESLIVDVREKCKFTMVYIADSLGYGLIVYSLHKDLSWRIENRSFKPDPKFVWGTIAGETLKTSKGIYSLSVSPSKTKDERFLYFHSLAGDTQYKAALKFLDNELYWQNKSNKYSSIFQSLGSRGVQCSAGTIDNKGNYFCGLFNPIALFRWNISTPYNSKTFKIAAYDPDTLQFVSGIKIIKSRYGRDELWLVSNRLQKHHSNSIDPHEINYRIRACRIEQLMKGENCLVSIINVKRSS